MLVRAAVDRTARTGTCVVVVARDGARSMYPDAGANAHLSVDDLPVDLLAGTAPLHLHVSGYALLSRGARSAALAAMAGARVAGHSVSVDPASAGPIASVGTAEVLGWLADADLVLANHDEACLLTGAADADGGRRTARHRPRRRGRGQARARWCRLVPGRVRAGQGAGGACGRRRHDRGR